MTDTRKALAGSDILAFAEGAPVDLSGAGPLVRFTLDDGTEIDVAHEGNHLTVRNRGTRGTSALSIEPQASNTVGVRGLY